MNDKNKNDELLTIDGDNNDILLQRRVSVPLTPKNARFFRSKGNLVSMELLNEDGTKEYFERIVALRSFPITNPDEFISIREIGVRKSDKGKEIGMIRYLSDFDEASTVLINEELDRRYFTPEILKILSIKEKFGYYYWDVDTSSGHVVFILNNPFSNVRILDDGRVYIYDMDGNSFSIQNAKNLDPASFKRIETYL